MAKHMAESCDLCGEYRKHDDLVTVHALGEPVDVCTSCQAEPVGKVLATASARSHEAQVEPGPGE